MKRLALVAASTLVLAGCAATPTPAADDSRLQVIASTNVYGSIAESIGGDLIEVTSIITGANQDPHSYEASARDQLAISEADLLILNGGGYDPFMETLIDASGTTAPVISAVDVSGLLDDEATDDDATDDHDHAEDETDGHADDHGDDDGHHHIEGFNEHGWYNFDAMEHPAEEIAHELGTLDPANAATYDANADAFAESIDQLDAQAEGMHTTLEGKGAAMTEPVPGYLLAAVGLNNLTPAEFTEAIEEGSDVPPLALQQTLDLFTSGAVVVLAYNEQTASPETEVVRQASETAGIPVVNFTETLPDGEDYVSWMTSNLAALAAALG